MFRKKKNNENEISTMNYEIEIEELRNSINELKAQIHKLQYPNGEIRYECKSGFLFIRGDIKYLYSNNNKMHSLTLVSNDIRVSIDSYKICVENNTAYIGIKYIPTTKEAQNLIESYFAVDLEKNNVVRINNKLSKEFDVDWINWNK